METSQAYRSVRERMIALVREVDPVTPVPACPEWTVRELVAHVTGVAADVLAGRLEGAGTQPWVDAQLDARAAASLDELVAEWAESGPQVDDVCSALGDAIAQLVFDLVCHEQDLRGALDEPGGRDGALDVALRWASETWATQPTETGALRLCAGATEVTLGEGPPTATLTLPPFEALRALTGRRSVPQLLAYEWDGDGESWLPAFTWGPFRPAAGPVVEG